MKVPTEFDPDIVDEIGERIKVNGNLIDEIVDRLVADYCKPLDDYVLFIKSILDDDKNPPNDLELDDFTLNLPVLLYFTGEAQESLGIREDIAKAIRQDLFNSAFNLTDGTIADKTARAELAVQNEQVAYIAYQRAYRKVRLRMEAGYEILQSVKKVITRRERGYDLAKVDPGRVGG